MVFSHHRDLECGGNAAALALFATDSSRGTSAHSNRSAESQSAAAGGALQMAFKMMHHLLVYKGVGLRPGLPCWTPSGSSVSSQKLAQSLCVFVVSAVKQNSPQRHEEHKAGIEGGQT